jgi:hypothetical protein
MRSGASGVARSYDLRRCKSAKLVRREFRTKLQIFSKALLGANVIPGRLPVRLASCDMGVAQCSISILLVSLAEQATPPLATAYPPTAYSATRLLGYSATRLLGYSATSQPSSRTFSATARPSF